MSAWDELAASTQTESFFEDASEHFRVLQELVGEWQEIMSISADAVFAEEETKAQSLQRITQATSAHAAQVQCACLNFSLLFSCITMKFS